MYEVVTTQVAESKGRVIRKEFNSFEAERQYADDICLNDNRTMSCSIYRSNFLVMDVL